MAEPIRGPLKITAPCKLNLFLYITGKRPDGYHNLQTLFTFLDDGDDIEAQLTDKAGQIELHGPFDFPPERNSMFKACSLLFELAHRRGKEVKHGICFKVEKRIPEGGGLGGGSSDGAAALLLANCMTGLNFTNDELCTLAVKIGADVPVFTRGHSAFASGVGEKLQPVDLPQRYYLVAAPHHCQVNTARAFADPALKRDSPQRSLDELLRLPPHNDFTDSVVKNYPEIGQLLELLVKYAPAHLSGSGACCFASFDSRQAAEKAFNAIKSQHHGPLFLARSLNRSPVHDALLTL